MLQKTFSEYAMTEVASPQLNVWEGMTIMAHHHTVDELLEMVKERHSEATPMWNLKHWEHECMVNFRE